MLKSTQTGDSSHADPSGTDVGLLARQAKNKQLNWFRGLLILGIIWLAGALCDRLWFALDRSVPAWDQADYLNGAMNYWQALQAPPVVGCPVVEESVATLYQNSSTHLHFHSSVSQFIWH